MREALPHTGHRSSATTGGLYRRPSSPNWEHALHRIDQLTPQQTRVFALLSEGLSNKQIARLLGLHESTVKVHVSAILAKLGCANRTIAALLALYHRLQPEPAADRTMVDIQSADIGNA